MKNYGLASIDEFLKNFLVYRNLEPVDSRLPTLAMLRPKIGLDKGQFPRKTQLAYAHAINHILQAAREIEAPGTTITKVICLGDTILSDGTAFSNICQTGNKHGAAFIGSENDAAPAVERIETPGGFLYKANRWGAVEEFKQTLKRSNFIVDAQTVILVDLDKTSIGARGRNDKIIDRIRIEAAYETLNSILGPQFEPDVFEKAYTQFNQPEFHQFTTDNQDYLVYLCLMLGSGLFIVDEVVEQIRSGIISSFNQFTETIQQRIIELPEDLQNTHVDFYAQYSSGNPTPFKAFRVNEYLNMCKYMGKLPVNASVDNLLKDEVAITQEIRQIAQEWHNQGALLFGLSDKPDEASIPGPDLIAQGYLPIHKIKTHAVGG